MFRSLIQQTKHHFNQHNRQYARSHRYKPNLGIRRQAEAETNEVESNNDVEDLSKFESHFYNTSDTYDEYRHESKEEKDKVKRYIVRNKYFNEKKMTFLTWTEMEQIRLLHRSEPEEWNVHKLAESFPADLLTIKKVLKANWQPKDTNRIAKHDEKVRLNWKSFIDGKVDDLDPKFNEHLTKFSNRNLNLQINYDNVLKKELPQPRGTEFLNIITSCKKYKEEPRKITSGQSKKLTDNLPEVPSNETFLLGHTGPHIVSHKLVTFKPTKSIENHSDNVPETEIIFNNPSGTGIKKTTTKDNAPKQSSALVKSKYETNEVRLSENDLKQLSIPSIRQNIEIPANLYRKDATYQLGDCYYDDDGELLYRVPGMSGRE